MTDTTITTSHPRPAGKPAGDHKRGLFSNRRINLILGWGLPILIVLAGFVYWVLPTLLYPPAPENAPMPVSADLENQYGIRITQLAVTADGGMIDFRYIVLDSDKAHNFALDDASTPVLIPETGNVIDFKTAQMPHNNVMQAGVTYFLLYDDTLGSIKPHTYVTVVLGNIKIRRVPVR